MFSALLGPICDQCVLQVLRCVGCTDDAIIGELLQIRLPKTLPGASPVAVGDIIRKAWLQTSHMS